MDTVTLLATPDELDAGEAKVVEEAYKHLFRARRVPVGTTFRVVDGFGRARWGEVTRVDRSSATVALGDPAPTGEPAYRLELLVAAFRPERASWLVEKATELGVSAIRFLETLRAQRVFGDGAVARFRRVAAAALEQCHRSRLPDITGPHSWDELADIASGLQARWVLDTQSTGTAAGWGERGESGGLLIGPEGGWDEGERRDLLRAGWRPVGLGERVLRVETAAVAGAALLLLDTSSIKP